MIRTSLIFGFILSSLSIQAQNELSRKIDFDRMQQVAELDIRFQSYNIEMCEVIGGEFWVPYELLDSVLQHTDKKGFDALKWGIEPINLYDNKLRKLASALGPTYVRVSGTWANDVYFQNNDEPKLADAPTGFNNVLTRKQWKGVIEFCNAVNGKLVTSFPISDGMRNEHGVWQPVQVQSLLDYTQSIGGEIVAAEFFNEPSHALHGGAPEGYNGASFAREFALFEEFVREAAPEMLIIGPGSTGEGGILPSGLQIPVEDIFSSSPKPTFDVFTYHYYGTVSKRCGGQQTPEKALTEEWLSRTEKGLQFYEDIRDIYLPKVPIWLTETAEAACGGNPWAATYLDAFRYLEQLGRLAKKSVQVVMHNTLTRSEYALLDNDTHDPRPSYWAALLWSKLMGVKVFEGGDLEAGVDIFVHNLKGTSEGKAVLLINTKQSESSVEIPYEAMQYLLSANQLITKTVMLNDKELRLTENNEIPDFSAKKISAGKVILPPHSIMFLAFDYYSVH